jgi:BirA family biotin operon repressor/biotin-[acetyl-CoA-carboxylase] ligase
LAQVDSTLSEAVRIAPELAGPEWILAHVQTAPRGRRGRVWSMQKGNFAATLVMPLDVPPGQAALRSFVAALALRDAFVAVSGRADAFALKWPNDVLLRGGKVAGILLETAGVGKGVSHLAIGIGVNLVAAPSADAVEPGAVPPVSLKAALGVDIAPEDFLDHLAQAFDRHETRFRTYGFAPVRTEWLANAARLGAQITARTTRETYQGSFVDVDGDGQLVLETPEGRISIPAGDVYF